MRNGRAHGWRDASFACTRAHARDYLGEGRGGGLQRVEERATVVAGNSRQRRWAGSGIPRRARVSAGTHQPRRRAARKRGRGELSRGRSPTAARTLLLVEEDSPVRGCQHPFFSRLIARGEGKAILDG